MSSRTQPPLRRARDPLIVRLCFRYGRNRKYVGSYLRLIRKAVNSFGRKENLVGAPTVAFARRGDRER